MTYSDLNFDISFSLKDNRTEWTELSYVVNKYSNLISIVNAFLTLLVPNDGQFNRDDFKYDSIFKDLIFKKEYLGNIPHYFDRGWSIPLFHKRYRFYEIKRLNGNYEILHIINKDAPYGDFQIISEFPIILNKGGSYYQVFFQRNEELFHLTALDRMIITICKENRLSYLGALPIDFPQGLSVNIHFSLRYSKETAQKLSESLFLVCDTLRILSLSIPIGVNFYDNLNSEFNFFIMAKNFFNTYSTIAESSLTIGTYPAILDIAAVDNFLVQMKYHNHNN